MSIIRSMEPKDHSEATRIATAIATPRVELAVRSGQRSRCRATITPVWGRFSRRRSQVARSRYTAGDGGAIATAGGSLTTDRTA